MDELKFRRQAYGEPNNQDPEFLQAAMESAEREAFLNDLKGLDNKIENALKIDVPDDLAAKLLLRQQLQHHHSQRRKNRLCICNGRLGSIFSWYYFYPIKNGTRRFRAACTSACLP